MNRRRFLAALGGAAVAPAIAALAAQHAAGIAHLEGESVNALTPALKVGDIVYFDDRAHIITWSSSQ